MATRVGVVAQLWCYPVKSMGGEQLASAAVGADGIAGDRGYALRDERAAEIRGAKNIPELLRCQARYLERPAGGRIPAAAIVLPNGTTLRSDAVDVSVRLSTFLGREVTLWPRRPATDLEHYRRALPEGGDPMAELRRVFGLDEHDPLPPLDQLPPELFQYVSPLGTYFDAFPLHLLTTATLRSLTRHHPTGRFDVRRFRPNVLIDLGDDADGFPEEQWGNHTLRVGGVEVTVTMPAMRCVMTMAAQGDLSKDPLILRTIVKQNRSNAGVYATVTQPGEIKVGDAVQVSDAVG